MKVLVCGGRDFQEVGDLHKFMNALHSISPITLVIHGAARGADTAAGNWAKSHGVPIKEYPADWDKYKKAAGPIRNQLMLDDGKPDIVIAFPGGRGTENMISLAKKFGVNVIRGINDSESG